MTRDALDRLAALAPDRPVDPDGLSDARALFERGRSHGLVRPARPVRRRATPPWGRLALAAGLATTTAAAVLVATVVVGPGGTPGESPSRGPLLGLVPAAAAADPSCAGAQVDEDLSTPVPSSAWADSPVADVAALVGERRPDRVSASQEVRHCPVAVAAAVVFDPDQVRGVNVYRDVATGSLTQIETLGTADEVSLRGVDAWVLSWVNDPGVPRQRLTWIDQDGARWYAVAEGMAVHDTVALLDALEFDDDGALDPASVPDDFAAASNIDPEIGERSPYTWSVEYGASDRTVVDDRDGGLVEQTGPSYRYLEVSTPATAPVEAEIAEFRNEIVDLDGTPAAWTLQGQGGAELRWVRDGVRYRLVAPVDSLDAMREIARSVEHVALDDPRLG